MKKKSLREAGLSAEQNPRKRRASRLEGRTEQIRCKKPKARGFIACLLAPLALADRPRFHLVAVDLVLDLMLDLVLDLVFALTVGLAILGAVLPGGEVAVGLSGSLL